MGGGVRNVGVLFRIGVMSLYATRSGLQDVQKRACYRSSTALKQNPFLWLPSLGLTMGSSMGL